MSTSKTSHCVHGIPQAVVLWLLVVSRVCLVLLLLRPFRNVLAASPTSPSPHSPHNLPHTYKTSGCTPVPLSPCPMLFNHLPCTTSHHSALTARYLGIPKSSRIHKTPLDSRSRVIYTFLKIQAVHGTSNLHFTLFSTFSTPPLYTMLILKLIDARPRRIHCTKRWCQQCSTPPTPGNYSKWPWNGPFPPSRLPVP